MTAAFVFSYEPVDVFTVAYAEQVEDTVGMVNFAFADDEAAPAHHDIADDAEMDVDGEDEELEELDDLHEDGDDTEGESGAGDTHGAEQSEREG